MENESEHRREYELSMQKLRSAHKNIYYSSEGSNIGTDSQKTALYAFIQQLTTVNDDEITSYIVKLQKDLIFNMIERQNHENDLTRRIAESIELYQDIKDLPNPVSKLICTVRSLKREIISHEPVFNLRSLIFSQIEFLSFAKEQLKNDEMISMTILDNFYASAVLISQCVEEIVKKESQADLTPLGIPNLFDTLLDFANSEVGPQQVNLDRTRLIMVAKFIKHFDGPLIYELKFNKLSNSVKVQMSRYFIASKHTSNNGFVKMTSANNLLIFMNLFKEVIRNAKEITETQFEVLNGINRVAEREFGFNPLIKSIAKKILNRAQLTIVAMKVEEENRLKKMANLDLEAQKSKNSNKKLKEKKIEDDYSENW